MSLVLRDLGFKTVEADFSLEMILQGLKRHGGRGRACAVADIQELLPFRDASFDLVVTWRFLHHLPTKDLLDSILGELARVSKAWVIVSFFHPWSLHHLARTAGRFFLGRKGCRFARTASVMKQAAGGAGLSLVCSQAEGPLRDLWGAVFRKTQVRNDRHHSEI